MKKSNRYTKGLRWMHRWMLCAILLISLNTLEAQSVKVGDLMTFSDGSKGIVCYVDPENEQKGWVVDLNDVSNLTYSLTTTSSIPSTIRSNSANPSVVSLSTWTPEGLANTTALYLMNDGSNYSPAAQAVNPESGWYIPDAQQMIKLVGMVALLQPAFAKAGGNITRLVLPGRHYWTSSRNHSIYFYYLQNSSTTQGSRLSSNYSTYGYHIRRVRDFNLGYTLQTYWGDDPDNTTLQLSPSADTSLTALVIYGPDTFELHQSVYVHPTFNKDTIYGDTVYSGIPFDKDFHNVTFHVDGPGNDTLYDTLKTVYGCDSIQTVILRIRQPNELFIDTTVCQSQVNGFTGPYQSLAFAVFGESTVDSLVKASGYIYKENVYLKDDLGNDSTVNFYLTVHPAPQLDTTVTIIIKDLTSTTTGYYWFDSLYTTSGTHTRITQTEEGCDSLHILRLVILDVDTTADTTCTGTPVELTIPVTTRGITPISGIPHIGDVLCTDGSVMRPDDYLSSDKTAMGVVFYVDIEKGVGRAIALSDAHPNKLRWASNEQSANIHSTSKPTFPEAVLDMEGEKNTNEILRTARIAGGAQNTPYHASAAHFCKFYNHHTYTAGTDSLGWYLPAAGEMRLIYSVRVELNKTLTQLNAQNPKNAILTNLSGNNGNYWTSTENNSGVSGAYAVSYHGFLQAPPGNKRFEFYARPVIQFPLP